MNMLGLIAAQKAEDLSHDAFQRCRYLASFRTRAETEHFNIPLEEKSGGEKISFGSLRNVSF